VQRARKVRPVFWCFAVPAVPVGVRGEGRRNFGKKKLSVNESRKLVAQCLVMAGSSNPKKRVAGIAVQMALLLGMRA